MGNPDDWCTQDCPPQNCPPGGNPEVGNPEGNQIKNFRFNTCILHICLCKRQTRQFLFGAPLQTCASGTLCHPQAGWLAQSEDWKQFIWRHRSLHFYNLQSIYTFSIYNCVIRIQPSLLVEIYATLVLFHSISMWNTRLHLWITANPLFSPNLAKTQRIYFYDHPETRNLFIRWKPPLKKSAVDLHSIPGSARVHYI